MAKKAVNIQLEESTINVLKALASKESRSQAGEIRHLILKEAKEKGVEVTQI